MLAYLDSFAGLVPCRIVAVGVWRDGSSQARVQYTATRGAYRRGDFGTHVLRHVVPRTAIRRRKYSTRIAAYSWPLILADKAASLRKSIEKETE